MKLITDIKLGADPELFVWDKTKQQFKSSIGLIGAGKLRPRPMSPGFFAQEDNVLVEFNIPPVDNRKDFIFAIESGKWQIQKLIGDSFDLRAQASAFIPMEELQHPEAWQFGCEPDNNAWKKGEFNTRPITPMDGFRTGGGHVHFGYTVNVDAIEEFGLTINSVGVELVKQLDKYLGIPSILMDSDSERRKLYGKAGAFRPKSYGVEYRVLSSFWVQDRTHAGWVWDQSMRAVEQLAEGNLISKEAGEEIEYTINSQSVANAKELCDLYDLPY